MVETLCGTGVRRSQFLCNVTRMNETHSVDKVEDVEDLPSHLADVLVHLDILCKSKIIHADSHRAVLEKTIWHPSRKLHCSYCVIHCNC